MKMKRSLLLAVAATVACAVIVSSCRPDTVTVTGVTLDRPTLTLTEGESATLKATVKPDNAENKAVAWKSDKTDVATVDNSGKVTAVKEGSATIVVSTADGGKTAKCVVTVKAGATPPPPPPPPPAPVISIATQPTAPQSLTEGSIPAGTCLTVEATVTGDATLSYKWYIWDKENDKVSEAIDGATGASLTLTSTLKAGEYWYICEISAPGAETKFSAAVKVTVGARQVESSTLRVNPDIDLSIPAGLIGKPITRVDVSKAVSGGKAPYTYSASGLPSGLVVSTAGIISGTPTTTMSAGTATITITDSSSPAQTITVTVRYGAMSRDLIAVTDIKDVPTAAIGGIDLALTGTVVPANATNRTIVWSVKSDGGTGATIATGTNVLKTVTGGTVVVTATIAKGLSSTTPYRKDFTVVVATPANEIIFGGENEEEWP